MGAPMLYLAEPMAASRSVEADEKNGKLRFKSDGCELVLELDPIDLRLVSDAIFLKRFHWAPGFLEGSACLDGNAEGENGSREVSARTIPDGHGGVNSIRECERLAIGYRPAEKTGSYSFRPHSESKPEELGTLVRTGLQLEEDDKRVCGLVAAMQTKTMELVRSHMDRDTCGFFSLPKGCQRLVKDLVWMCLNISECDELKYRVKRQDGAQAAFIKVGFGPTGGDIGLLKRITGTTTDGSFTINNDMLEKLAEFTDKEVTKAVLRQCLSAPEIVTCAIHYLSVTDRRRML